MSRTSRERSSARFFLALALAIIWAPAAQARTTIIDDAGTQALEPSVSLRWKTASPGRGAASNVMVGRMTLRVRLNVLPWLKRRGRIYLALPAQPPGAITAAWTTQGRLAPGQLVSGNRLLLYAGPITTPLIEDVVTFQFSVDGRLVSRPFPVNLRFEMDED
jgi:hypothetical protein